MVLFLINTFVFSNYFFIKMAINITGNNIDIYSPRIEVVIIILLVATIGKCISRYGYISTWISSGLIDARESAGGGGIYSYLSIFFYPAAILFLTSAREKIKAIDRKIIFFVYTIIFSFLLIDMIFVGTRNVPVFILLLYAISWDGRYKISFKLLISMSLLILAFLYMFHYTTSQRLIGDFDWRIHIENTISTQVLSVSPNVLDIMDSYVSFLYPLLFLFHYLSHSISELAFLINNAVGFGESQPAYLIVEFCSVSLCDKSYYESLILENNIRSGVYQTLFASLFYDHGVIKSIIIVALLSFINTMAVIFLKKISVINYIFLIIVALSPIENYLYGGLGLIQISLIYVIYFISCIRFFR
ncbi:hypothetical protein [Vibrio sp. AH4]|uniref:hypothetical protein n=1 Tax=Vibrio sp. AH4 TaxID=2919577 RepID=UPI002739A04A|nr:hypothetical protein [Vibrio sp. AH4]MDP4491807.1 hypothetical protein [Vibrio sp. AH4]